MRDGETMHVVPWIYPDHVTWRDKHEKRPGIAVVWAETHGPLDQSFPWVSAQAMATPGRGSSLSRQVTCSG